MCTSRCLLVSARHDEFPWLTTYTCTSPSFWLDLVAFGDVHTRSYRFQDSDPDKFDRAKLVEVLTAPYIEDSGDGIVALDPHALKKLFTTTSSLLQASLLLVLSFGRSQRKGTTDTQDHATLRPRWM